MSQTKSIDQIPSVSSLENDDTMLVKTGGGIKGITLQNLSTSFGIARYANIDIPSGSTYVVTLQGVKTGDVEISGHNSLGSSIFAYKLIGYNQGGQRWKALSLIDNVSILVKAGISDTMPYAIILQNISTERASNVSFSTNCNFVVETYNEATHGTINWLLPNN